MRDFTLDTAGEVCAPVAMKWPTDPQWWPGGRAMRWPDLSPFEQGYVEALLRSFHEATGSTPITECSFSDLDPSALALILRDCTNYGNGYSTNASWCERPNAGGDFWRQRQSGIYGEDRGNAFPPLTPYLGDDGKVCLKETER